jgi:hypothetical protein
MNHSPIFSGNKINQLQTTKIKGLGWGTVGGYIIFIPNFQSKTNPAPLVTIGEKSTTSCSNSFKYIMKLIEAGLKSTSPKK